MSTAENSPSLFTIPQNLLLEIQAHAGHCYPEEVCGLLGGSEKTVHIALPVTNILHSATRFRMDPSEQLRGLVKIEEMGYELIAIYHSHPHGPPTPSETDITSHFYPGVYTLILSKKGESWDCRVFDIQGQAFKEIPRSSI